MGRMRAARRYMGIHIGIAVVAVGEDDSRRQVVSVLSSGGALDQTAGPPGRSFGPDGSPDQVCSRRAQMHREMGARR